MKNKFIIILTVLCSLTACGQKKINQKKPKNKKLWTSIKSPTKL